MLCCVLVRNGAGSFLTWDLSRFSCRAVSHMRGRGEAMSATRNPVTHKYDTVTYTTGLNTCVLQ